MRLASARISSGNVAEKSRVCRRAGSSATMRLVEHERLDVPEIDVALGRVVEQASRRCDEHVDAATEQRDLRAQADAAVDDGRRERQMFAVVAHALADLSGELARRREDQRPDAARAAGGRAREPREQRQREAGGLTRAGLRAGQHVAAREHERDHALLDRRGLRIALIGDCAQQRRREAERIERHS
jgi:hypothetical protein